MAEKDRAPPRAGHFPGESGRTLGIPVGKGFITSGLLPNMADTHQVSSPRNSYPGRPVSNPYGCVWRRIEMKGEILAQRDPAMR